MLFYGVVIVTAFQYFSKYWGRDRLALRLVVIASVVASLGDTVASLGWAYLWTVTHWGNPMTFISIPWFFHLQQMSYVFSIILNESFFAWRLYGISSSMKLPGLILALEMHYVGVVIWTEVYMARNPTWEDFVTLNSKLYRSAFGVSMGADVIISAGMIWYLIIKPRMRGDGQLPLPSQSLFKSIALRTLQFNSLSLLVQTTQLIVSFLGTDFWFLIPFAVQSKVYALSIIISLTSRGTDRGTLPKTNFDDFISMDPTGRSQHISEPYRSTAYPPTSTCGGGQNSPNLSGLFISPIEVHIETGVSGTSGAQSWKHGNDKFDVV